jgi:hypothetical protein
MIQPVHPTTDYDPGNPGDPLPGETLQQWGERARAAGYLPHPGAHPLDPFLMLVQHELTKHRRDYMLHLRAALLYACYRRAKKAQERRKTS